MLFGSTHRQGQKSVPTRSQLPAARPYQSAAPPSASHFLLPSYPPTSTPLACQCGLPWLTDNKRQKKSSYPPPPSTPFFFSLRWNESLPCQGLGCWTVARRYPAIYCPAFTPDEEEEPGKEPAHKLSVTNKSFQQPRRKNARTQTHTSWPAFTDPTGPRARSPLIPQLMF